MRVPRSALTPLNADLQPGIEAECIAYVVATAKVPEVLEGSTSATDGHVLLLPMESNVIPLPTRFTPCPGPSSATACVTCWPTRWALAKTIEAKSTLGLLLNNPVFFPFQLPVMTGDLIAQRSERIEVVLYGLDDELLKLTAKNR